MLIVDFFRYFGKYLDLAQKRSGYASYVFFSGVVRERRGTCFLKAVCFSFTSFTGETSLHAHFLLLVLKISERRNVIEVITPITALVATFALIDMKKPEREEITAIRTERVIILSRLCENSYAAAAGATSMTTVRMDPTTLKATTVATAMSRIMK